MVFNWFWNLLPNNRADCVSCGDKYAKDAMKELWYKYEEDDGSTGTASVFLCDPCSNQIAEELERRATEYEQEEIILDGF